jgi:hypothetical protein
MTQNVYFSRLMRVYVGLIMLAAYTYSFKCSSVQIHVLFFQSTILLDVPVFPVSVRRFFNSYCVFA